MRLLNCKRVSREEKEPTSTSAKKLDQFLRLLIDSAAKYKLRRQAAGDNLCVCAKY